jgi:hypothetical protein
VESTGVHVDYVGEGKVLDGNVCTIGHCFQGSFQGPLHLYQKGNLIGFTKKQRKTK